MDLPRGGRTIFPKYQLVGYVGMPGSPSLGPLDKDLDGEGHELEKLSQSVRGRADAAAGDGADRRGREGARGARTGCTAAGCRTRPIEEYLAVARKHRMLLLLDIQPGRAKILPEVKRLERWLKEPDVGLAFDPEWAVGPSQVPGRVFGHTTGAELDSIASYLSGLVQADDLPEKAFVYHQLSPRSSATNRL